MGLVLSSTSRSFYTVKSKGTKTKDATGVRKRRTKKAESQQGVLSRLWSPQVIAGTAAVGLVAVFVGLVASTFRTPAQA
jgi:hypothetical protein